MWVGHFAPALPARDAQMTSAVQAFFILMRERRAGDLETWLEEATVSGIPELAAFAKGVRRDLAAVKAAMTLPWSQGQTEGQVNRLKLLKRQMYGRANPDLLCQRDRYRAANLHLPLAYQLAPRHCRMRACQNSSARTCV
jgi:hypothetical protein